MLLIRVPADNCPLYKETVYEDVNGLSVCHSLLALGQDCTCLQSPVLDWMVSSKGWGMQFYFVFHE